MKQALKISLAVLMLAVALPIGCVKTPDGSNSGMPDISNFAIEAASTWTAGAASLISISSSTLGAGTFIVHFNLTGANNLSGLTTTLDMSGGTGTFQTPVLTISGETNVIITSISNSSGASSNLTSNNSYTFADSTGIMTATVNGVASFRSTHVTALLPGGAGATLAISGVKWNPLTTINLYIANFPNTPMTMTFTSFSDFAGSTHYSAPAPVNSQFGAHGHVTVTTVSPLLTGSFTFTNEDSSVVIGNFSCPHP